MKIKSITLKNFRGVKEEVTLKANSKSVLLYGDNGSGKSSFLDAIEWFVTDKIEHLNLTKEKYEVLRNRTSDNKVTSVSLECSHNINHTKQIKLKKGGKVESTYEKKR